MIIVGTGMSGLLAAVMLRNEATEIFEVQPSIPNNHSAVLRFRSSVVADVTGIPFKSVGVVKGVQPWQHPVADAIAYSRKTNGTVQLRSIITAEGKPEQRYIAPPDFITQLVAKVQGSCKINLGTRYDDFKCDVRDFTSPVISTLPMPVLMEALGWERKSKFGSVSGVNVIVDLDPTTDIYCSVYVPDPKQPFSRVSITGNQLIAECYDITLGWIQNNLRDVAIAACQVVGLFKDDIYSLACKEQHYAKILPVDEAERRQFIMWASEEFGVYSLGRFATWRPGLLMDDVVNDVRVIQRLTTQRVHEVYDHKLKI